MPYSIKAFIKNKKSGEAFEIRDLGLLSRNLSKYLKIPIFSGSVKHYGIEDQIMPLFPCFVKGVWYGKWMKKCCIGLKSQYRK